MDAAFKTRPSGGALAVTGLARLCCWAPPDRVADLAAECERRLLPVLREQGLAESAESGRPTAPGVFARLFEVEDAGAVERVRARLERDPAWDEALQRAGAGLGASGRCDPVHWALEPYRVPAGPGLTNEVGSGLRQGLWQSFGADDGLPVADIAAMLTDRKGDLWIASSGLGVCRFDGAAATVYRAADGLAGDRVADLAEDGDGRLWCATDRGLSRFDGREWCTYAAADGLAAGAARAVLVDGRGRLWCGTEGGLCWYDGRIWAAHAATDGPPDAAVSALAEDRHGRLWCGTAHGARRFDGRAWVTHTTADGLAHERVSAMAADRQGRLWCGSWTGGTSCWDGETWRVWEPGGPVPGRVLSIVEDREGALWFGTDDAGVWRYDGARGSRHTVADGLVSDHVHTLEVDRAGDLWAGTGTGLSRYRQGQFHNLTSRDGLAADGVVSIGEDLEGRPWFGTFGGRASRRDGASFASVEIPATHGAVWAVHQDRQGRMWFGTAQGLFEYDGHRFAGVAYGPGNGCRALLQDRAGRLWAGTGMAWETHGAGLRRLERDGWTTFTRADGLAGEVACSLLEDRQGALWIGGELGALSRYDGEGFGRVDGLPPFAVAALAEDREGRLWAASWGGGVWRRDADGGFARLEVAGRSPYAFATSLLADRNGRLWVGTWGGGVYLSDGQVLQRLSRQDGLVHDGVQALRLDRHGDVWIATEGGVTRYRPGREAPAVRVTDAVADRRYGPVPELAVPASQRLVAFEFRGRSWTTRPEAMAYVYRLTGHEAAWRTTHGRRAEYHDLPLGDYTFEVRAVDRDLNYSESAAVRLHVVPDPRLEAMSQALSGATDRFIGSSVSLQRVLAQLAQVAPTDLTVVVLGETGTGKGLAARLVHQHSRQRSGPFLPVNCGGIPPGLLESELFGHEKGAFTGAVARKLGKVELAQGGTLFLDEVGDLPAEGQAKLLRLLEERTFERVGGTQTLTAQVRVIAATNRDLAGMVAAGQFRQDLYFRLHAFTVSLPPLRQRAEDIPELALFFAVRMASHLDKPIEGFEPSAMALLQGYAWPGNVRELEHAVQRAVVVATGTALRVDDFTLHGPTAAAGPAAEALALTPEEYERSYLLQALERSGWTIKGPQGAAARLGVSPSTLHGRLKKLGITRPAGR